MAARVGSGHVLLCVTDHESAAATSELVNHLGDSGFQVKVILASGAKRFVKGLSLDQALDDEAEWYAWKKARNSQHTLHMIDTAHRYDCKACLIC